MPLRNELVDLISREFGRGQQLAVADEDSLLDAGILDSLTLMELVTLLSERYGITVDEDEVTPENLDSIGGLTRFLASKGVAGDAA